MKRELDKMKDKLRKEKKTEEESLREMYLPEEIWIMIMRHIKFRNRTFFYGWRDLKETMKMRLVCKNWSRIIFKHFQTIFILCTVAVNIKSHSMVRALNNMINLKCITMYYMPTFDTKEILDTLSSDISGNITSLTITEHYGNKRNCNINKEVFFNFDIKKFECLQTLKLVRSMIMPSLSDISNLTNLTNLEIYNDKIEFPIEVQTLSNLKTLILAVGEIRVTPCFNSIVNLQTCVIEDRLGFHINRVPENTD